MIQYVIILICVPYFAVFRTPGRPMGILKSANGAATAPRPTAPSIRTCARFSKGAQRDNSISLSAGQEDYNDSPAVPLWKSLISVIILERLGCCINGLSHPFHTKTGENCEFLGNCVHTGMRRSG